MTISIYMKLYLFLHFKVDLLITFSIKLETDLYFKGDIICCMKCATFQFPVASNYLYNCIFLVKVVYLLILVLCVMFCRSLFVLLSFFFWSLCFLSFFDLRILINPLVSSNSSFKLKFSMQCFVDHCLFFCPVYFRHRVVFPSLIHGLLLLH